MICEKRSRQIVVFILLITITNVICKEKQIRIKLNKVKILGKPWAQFYENNNRENNNNQQINQQAHITLENYQNLAYIGEISFGNPSQNFKMLFDTGSEYIWIPDESISINHIYKRFNCTKSNTCILHNDQMVNIAYGAGSINGYIAYDSIKMNSDIEIKNQTFILSYEIIDMKNLIADGICGLGFSTNYPNLLDNLKNQGIIDKRMFSLYLDNNPEAYGDTFSELIINGINENSYMGRFLYIPLNSDNAWSLALYGAYLNNISIPINANNALIDSGSSLILVPQSDFDQIHSIIQNYFNYYCFIESNSRLLKCECPNGNVNNFPTLNFTFQNYTLSLPPSYYIDQDINVCTILIDGSSNITMWVLGDVFLRYYYTLFDMENKQIGFALANPIRYEHFNAIEIIIISFAIVLLCLFGVFIIYLLKFFLAKSKRNDNMQTLIDKNIKDMDLPKTNQVQ